MSDLFSSLLIFTIIKTILSTFFVIVSNFYKNLVKWALTEIKSSVAGTTTLDSEWLYITGKIKCYRVHLSTELVDIVFCKTIVMIGTVWHIKRNNSKMISHLLLLPTMCKNVYEYKLLCDNIHVLITDGLVKMNTLEIK